MFNIASIKNLGVIAKPLGAKGVSVLAAGAGDATLVTGTTVDRFTAGGGTITNVNLQVVGDCTLAAAETLGITIGYQASSDGSTWDAAVYVFGTTASNYQTIGTVTGSVGKSISLDCTGLKRYIRVLFTPDLSRGATDTARLTCAVISIVNTVETLENA